MNKPIGIMILATNAYFVLGVRLIQRFNYFYKGDKQFIFYFFSDVDPKDYLPTSTMNVRFIETHHKSWVEGTNSKFKNMLKLKNENLSHIIYMDADTTVNKNFTEEWFISNGTIGTEHFLNKSTLANGAGFDKNPIGQSYVPEDSTLHKMYFHGALFGGEKEVILEMCQILSNYQDIDQAINYEPPVNDESYINHFFHFNPPTTVILIENFQFIFSCKGGIEDSRKQLKNEILKEEILKIRNELWDLKQGIVIV